MFRKIAKLVTSAMAPKMVLGVDPTAADILQFLTDVGILWALTIGALAFMARKVYKYFRS